MTKIKRDRKGIRKPGIRNRLNGEDSLGLYALMDWYCQGHLTYEEVLARTQRYGGFYLKLMEAFDAGRNNPHHCRQINTIDVKLTTLILVLSEWDKRNFS